MRHPTGSVVKGDRARRSNVHTAVTPLSPARSAPAQDSDAAVSGDAEVAASDASYSHRLMTKLEKSTLLGVSTGACIQKQPETK